MIKWESLQIVQVVEKEMKKFISKTYQNFSKPYQTLIAVLSPN